MSEDRGTLYGHSIPNGPIVPDAEERARVKARDARIKAYRARERARVVAAFDRFFERMFNDPYGERPEWADPPVWLRTEAERSAGVGGYPTNGCDDTHEWDGFGKCVICGFTVPHPDGVGGDHPNEIVGTAPAKIIHGDGPRRPDWWTPEHEEAALGAFDPAVHIPTGPVGIHQKAGYGVRPGPECTCTQASDTGHDSECPRNAFARGASWDGQVHPAYRGIDTVTPHYVAGVE